MSPAIPIPKSLPRGNPELIARVAQTAVSALKIIYSAPEHATAEQMRKVAGVAAIQCASILKAEEQ